MIDLDAPTSLQKTLGQYFWGHVSLFIWSTSIEQTASI